LAQPVATHFQLELEPHVSWLVASAVAVAHSRAGTSRGLACLCITLELTPFGVTAIHKQSIKLKPHLASTLHLHAMGIARTRIEIVVAMVL
jgi:hypothetical protein